jgi:predicted nucleic acid-binding Zn ribbon protein
MSDERVPLYCLVDGKEIPEERERYKAVTCSDSCKRVLSERRRARKVSKVCRQCGRPSNPEERVLFMQWRRATHPPAKRGRPAKKTPPQPAQAEPPPETTVEV